ncbi:ankyrin-1-like [Trichogramma pretiosum]|uniref:ankyrin-1-like n=1 Tax=Trichogramma pretiosum TaxID=7493 RepID=UPI0006C9C2A1|nr:ankyrin-1-like [Trichogramma pretiosum]
MASSSDEWDFDIEQCDEVNQEKLSSLRRLLENVDFTKADERRTLLWRLDLLIKEWTSRLPDLLGVLRPEEIEVLLMDSMTNFTELSLMQERFVTFVARSGYKDQPQDGEDGKPAPGRTTPLHQVLRQRMKRRVAFALFKIYNRFDVNFIDNRDDSTHLHVACAAGCVDAVKKFLELGHDPNCLTRDEKSPLNLALRYEHGKVAELLLRNGADPNFCGARRYTPLHTICTRGNSDDELLAEMFFDVCDELRSTVRVNTQDIHGRTALHSALAMNSDNRKLVELLLRKGADPNMADNEGSTALHIICMRRDDGMIEMLLKICAELGVTLQVDARDKSGDTPLHAALSNGRVQTSELLLRNGANPNAANAKGSTPLHSICKHPEDSHILARRVIDVCAELRVTLRVNAQDASGDTALHVALSSGCRNLARLLLSNGANPNLANDGGLTALHDICLKADDQELAEMVFELSHERYKPIEVDARTKCGRTPLHCAMMRGHGIVGQFVLRHGADPNLADGDGQTPLHYICQREDGGGNLAEMFFEVVDEKRLPVQLDVGDNWGKTPLHWAVSYDRRVMELLLTRGAVPDAPDENRSTPLHFVCERDEDDDLVDAFFRLSTRPVNVEAVNDFSGTPLETAIENLLPHTVEQLIRHGADLERNFYFPRANSIGQRYHYEFDVIYVKLRLAANALAVVERLENGGYELELIDALQIMSFFDRLGLYENRANFPENVPENIDRIEDDIGELVEYINAFDLMEEVMRYNDTMIGPNLSIQDLCRLSPEEAGRLLVHHHFDFVRSKKISELSQRYAEACIVPLCEELKRRFFRRWAADCFYELSYFRLPILCCESVIDNLAIKDLWNICLAFLGRSSA